MKILCGARHGNTFWGWWSVLRNIDFDPPRGARGIVRGRQAGVSAGGRIRPAEWQKSKS